MGLPGIGGGNVPQAITYDTVPEGEVAVHRGEHVRGYREVSIHPPFTSLPALQAAVEAGHVPVAIGAQTCHFTDTGPYTGQVSALMLARLNVAYVIAGHSERAGHCGETDEVVRSKVDAICRHGMRPILCVGETSQERRDGAALAKVRWQVAAALSGRQAGRPGPWPRRSSPTSRSGPSAPARRPRPAMPGRCARRSGTR
jgi:triosephosphate isomerase